MEEYFMCAYGCAFRGCLASHNINDFKILIIYF